MNPNESFFRCRYIRHGPVALMAGRGGNSNFSMTLCGTLHIRFEQPLTVVLDWLHAKREQNASIFGH